MTGTVMIAADQVSNLFDLHDNNVMPMPDIVLVSVSKACQYQPGFFPDCVYFHIITNALFCRFS